MQTEDNVLKQQIVMKKTNLNLLSGVLAAGLTACSAYQGDFNEEWEFWSDSQPNRQVVDLPHDAMQTETRSADVPEGRHNGFYPGNVYHYEKTFNASADMQEKHVTLKFGWRVSQQQGAGERTGSWGLSLWLHAFRGVPGWIAESW